jgi:hypothetical protein
MNLNKHINALLYRYQCVTVPGFGAFVTENQSAQLNGIAVSFVPPRKVISFNANIKNNDGLLTNHVSLAEKLSYEEALTQIDIEVKNWLFQLENRETLTIENVGNIKFSKDNVYFFEPFRTTNFLTSSFGLSNFIAPTIKREELKKVVEELEEVTPIIFTPEKKKNYSYLKYAAAAVLFFGLAGTIGYKYHYDNQIEQQTLMVNHKVQEKVQIAVQEATFFIPTPLPEITVAVNENNTIIKPYHIVGGVFSSLNNASRAYNSLLKEGYEAELGDKNRKGMYPVYFQSFSTLNEAENFLQTLRKNPDSQAWLLID